MVVSYPNFAIWVLQLASSSESDDAQHDMSAWDPGGSAVDGFDLNVSGSFVKPSADGNPDGGLSSAKSSLLLCGT